MTDAAEASATTHTPTNTPSTSSATAAAALAGSDGSPQPATAAAAKLGASIFVSDDAPVYDMPVSAINRPLLSELDTLKVWQRQILQSLSGRVFSVSSAHVRSGGGFPARLFALPVYSLWQHRRALSESDVFQPVALFGSCRCQCMGVALLTPSNPQGAAELCMLSAARAY